MGSGAYGLEFLGVEACGIVAFLAVNILDLRGLRSKVHTSAAKGFNN